MIPPNQSDGGPQARRSAEEGLGCKMHPPLTGCEEHSDMTARVVQGARDTVAWKHHLAGSRPLMPPCVLAMWVTSIMLSMMALGPLWRGRAGPFQDQLCHPAETQSGRLWPFLALRITPPLP